MTETPAQPIPPEKLVRVTFEPEGRVIEFTPRGAGAFHALFEL